MTALNQRQPGTVKLNWRAECRWNETGGVVPGIHSGRSGVHRSQRKQSPVSYKSTKGPLRNQTRVQSLPGVSKRGTFGWFQKGINHLTWILTNAFETPILASSILGTRGLLGEFTRENNPLTDRLGTLRVSNCCNPFGILNLGMETTDWHVWLLERRKPASRSHSPGMYWTLYLQPAAQFGPNRRCTTMDQAGVESATHVLACPSAVTVDPGAITHPLIRRGVPPKVMMIPHETQGYPPIHQPGLCLIHKGGGEGGGGGIL